MSGEGIFALMEITTHSSILAWRIPWTEESGGLQSMGSQRVRHDFACMHSTKLKNILVSITIVTNHHKLSGLKTPQIYIILEVRNSSWISLNWSKGVSRAVCLPRSLGKTLLTCIFKVLKTIPVGDRKNKRKAGPGKGHKRNLSLLINGCYKAWDSWNKSRGNSS